MPAVDALVKALSRSDTILFIGSGVSLHAGLPTWKELITSLSDYSNGIGKDVDGANAAIEHGDYEDAAQLYNISEICLNYENLITIRNKVFLLP